MKKKILFVVRSYNDIDHFTPIIHYLFNSDLFEIEICSFRKKYEINNINLSYLKNNLSIKVNHLTDKISFIFDLIHRIIFNLKKFDSNKKYLEYLFNHLALFFENFLHFFYKKKVFKKIDQLLSDFKPEIICFDYIIPKNIFYFYITLKKDKDSILLSLPHGIMVFNEFSKNFNKNSYSIVSHMKNNNQYYDYMISTNEMNSSYLINSFYIDKSKIKILGSLRFYDNWLNIRDKHIINSNQKKNYDICIFLNKLMYKGIVSNIIHLLDTISSFKNISVAIKPHTRNMKTSFLKKYINNQNFYFVDNVPSSELIKNCNLFIFWGSSIGFEVIQKNKKFINASFCHGYTTVYDRYFPKLSVNDKELIKQIINKYILNPNDTFFRYDKTSFVTEIINGSDNLPVDKKFINFFKNLN